jgi:CMP/dCMP kinase
MHKGLEPSVVPLITIDGASGTGKSTVGLALAKQLGWHFLDTGLFYRALVWLALKESIAFNESALRAVVSGWPIRIDANSQVWHEQVCITPELLSEKISQKASLLAAFPSVRLALLTAQRSMLTPSGLLAVGRDVGTVVFPDAPLKIYLDASLEARAERRKKQRLALSSSGKSLSEATVASELEQRDKRDRTRSHAPLRAAEDAVYIDSSLLSVEQVVDKISDLWNGIA